MTRQRPSLEIADISNALLARELWSDDESSRMRIASTVAEWNLAPESLPALLDELERSRSRIDQASGIDTLVQRIMRRRTRDEARKPVTGMGPAFLGDGVSAGLLFNEAAPERLSAAGLPVLLSSADLAAALDVSEAHLRWLTYHRGATSVDHYVRFTIPKRSGGVRVISSPKPHLHHAQRWVLHEILEKIPIHDAAVAFRPGGSVLDHAGRHSGRQIVIRTDLKDFFATISFRRVKGLFAAFGYSEGIASILALLCADPPRVAIRLDDTVHHVTVGGFQLPQGACTSPAITNILCSRMDARLTGLANRGAYAYSRYADDMVFSTGTTNADIGRLLRGVRMVVEDEGFAINDDKTQIMRAPGRQIVTGLTVNDCPRIPREDLRRFRAFLHRCERDGLNVVSGQIGKSAHGYASGFLSWVSMIDPERASRIAGHHPWILDPQPETDR